MTPLEKLGLDEEATEEQLKERWRELASTHHPDRGGDAAQFNEYRKAYAAALEELKAPKGCELCKGTGKVLVGTGFQSVRMTCQECGGSGQR